MISTKPRVLIVDDDRAITQQLFWSLSEDYEVITAHDLSAAVRRATVYEPALSILDLHLPPTADSAETGLRLLDFIKQHHPQTKVLVVTAEATQEMRLKCFARGADGFLGKPFDIEHLLVTIWSCASQVKHALV
jgi:DNA-binding response OmpR family regulator